MYNKLGKPILDFLVSFMGLVIIFPFLLLLIILLLIGNRGSPIFIHERAGYRGKPFRLIKFRTMNNKRNESGKLLPDNDRLTSVGKFVRSLSLDELPQLINVLKGDMSLIGPRPLPTKYLPRYSKTQNVRHNVRPGITGWAQINGRNNISWEKKFEYDVYYVENYNFSLDMKILWMTLKKVIIREGINTTSNNTMEEFKGN